MLRIKDISDSCCMAETIILPSDFAISIERVTDNEGNTIVLLDETGNLQDEFYFEFFISGERDVYVCSAVRNTEGVFDLTNVAIAPHPDTGYQVVWLTFDGAIYPFHTTGKLCYRQKGRTPSDVMPDGVFDVWEEGKLPILLKSMSK